MYNRTGILLSLHRCPTSNPTLNPRARRHSMASKRKFSLIDSPPSSETLDDQEVTLDVKIVKTVTLKVKSSERIENIKALVKDRENDVPTNLQLHELVISGNKLEDGNKLSDYITVGNSIVNVVCKESGIQINVKRMSTDGIITTGLQVKMNDTIKLVKFMIDAREGTSSSEYRLIFDGEQLQDDMTIRASGLKNDSVLYMVLCPRDTVPLQIAMLNGIIEQIVVKPLNTIFDLKVALLKDVEMPIDQWELAYAGKFLENIRTVAWCGLEAGSLLHVILQERVQISVWDMTGNRITLFIKLTDDILSLKKQISEKTSVPIHCLRPIFSGKPLEDSRRIVSYGIQKDSIIHLVLRLGGPPPTSMRL
ncbi:unnamed protein product [Rhodiola kirilowii]